MNHALDCRDNPLSPRPGDTPALSPTQGFQNNLMGFRLNSNFDGIGALPANSANNHDQTETAEVNFVNPSKVATFQLSDSQCCPTDGSSVRLTGHDREVDQAVIDDDVAFPWSSTPASVHSERAPPVTLNRLDMSTDAISFSSPGSAVVQMQEVESNSSC